MNRLCLLGLLAACGGSTQTAAPTAAVVSVASTPNTAPNDAAIVELGRAEESYEAMVQFRLDCTTQVNLEQFVACFRENVGRLSTAAEETSAAFRLVTERDESSTSRLAAFSGEARTQNFVVTTILTTEIPRILPVSVQQMLAGQPVKQRILDELHEQVIRTMGQVFETTSSPFQCSATVRDVMALRLARDYGLDTTYSRESATRLGSVSNENIVACVDAAASERASEELPPYTPGELNLQR